MILLHLAVNGKPAILDQKYILIAEELTNEGAPFTRIYLTHPIPGETETLWVDVKESVEKIAKAIK